MKVFEEKGVRKYLLKRNLISQYKRIKQNFEDGRYQQIRLQKRQPKDFGELQFRISKKYRAYGYFKNAETFIVTEISDHQ